MQKPKKCSLAPERRGESPEALLTMPRHYFGPGETQDLQWPRLNLVFGKYHLMEISFGYITQAK